MNKRRLSQKAFDFTTLLATKSPAIGLVLIILSFVLNVTLAYAGIIEPMKAARFHIYYLSTAIYLFVAAIVAVRFVIIKVIRI